jgi:hypothetical protein
MLIRNFSIGFIHLFNMIPRLPVQLETPLTCTCSQARQTHGSDAIKTE